MKGLLFCLFISIVSLQSCGKKCSNDIPVIEIAPKVLDYFGVYKLGNWWIYENTTKTKQDSIFVTDFIDYSNCNYVDFISRRSRRFNINSMYLTTRVEKKFEVDVEDFSAHFFIYLILTNNKFEKSAESISLKQPELIDIFKLSNTQTFQNVLKVYNNPTYPEIPFALIAPNIGVISFVNSRDTFNLKTFKIN